ncbi:hypothetical protein B7494_g764 [Chlorociboria aeruginascens]|nr:hypothetical protein B7494_g764 [Chlorociboria aeruginascens]
MSIREVMATATLLDRPRPDPCRAGMKRMNADSPLLTAFTLLILPSTVGTSSLSLLLSPPHTLYTVRYSIPFSVLSDAHKTASPTSTLPLARVRRGGTAVMDTQWDNDTRGWIMCIVSGVACVAGASIICVDSLVRHIPGRQDFRIQESNIFLAASLSLSFGVMLFSALYSMLPSSKKYLTKSGFSPSIASWILLASFMGGFVGIQIVSRFLHHYIPSHVVDCDHSHSDGTHENTTNNSRTPSYSSHDHSRRLSHASKSIVETNGNAVESTPLLAAQHGVNRNSLSKHPSPMDGPDDVPDSRRPSIVQVQKRVMSFVKDTKTNCDEGGPCYGYTDPCGQECFKHMNAKTPTSVRHSTFTRTTTGNFPNRPSHLVQRTLEEEESDSETSPRSTTAVLSPRASRDPSREPFVLDEEDVEAQHHHHVPENAFLSIGLQTSIAIALHKLPEGFITYATNHANPSLGFSIFMALFVHNITEGFAMALPLYLALGSRVRAMFWSSLLGGISQPLGAGIAAAWFQIAGHDGHKPGSAVYGCMFAITAGIMTSVALQLFVESLSLVHNRNLCIASGFIGMSIMGMSNALTS